jgi:hypothetical protein
VERGEESKVGGVEERLRAALGAALSRPEGPRVETVEALEAAAKDPPAYGVAASALALADPAAAVPLLRRMLADENAIVAVEAAATLALLGDRAGLRLLRAPVRGATNSLIEYFLIHAALLLLGEPVPPPGRRPRSVFAALERLLDEASAPRGPEAGRP